MNELVVHEKRRMDIVPVAEIKDRVNAIEKLISQVMVADVDFGVIPFTNDKRVLFKPGAEKICAMFRIASRYSVEDLSLGDAKTYRVTCQGVSPAGEILGEGMGEASTGEEKYRWRKAVCEEEFNQTPESQRRVKYAKGRAGSGHYTILQIQTNAADSANTILKMACKRAHVAMVLSVTGCSSNFTQDVADDDPAPPGDDEAPANPIKTPQRKPPAGRAAAEAPGEIGLGERKYIERKVQEQGLDLAQVCADAGIDSLADLTPESFNTIKARLTA